MGQTQVQDARAVAYRAFCLGALLKRLELEITLQSLDEYTLPEDIRVDVLLKHYSLSQQLQRWLLAEGIAAHLTRSEALLLNRPLATWSDRLILNTSWRVEALGVMLWALQILDEIPDYDTQFEPPDVLRPLEILTPTIDLIWRAELRPSDELAAVRDCADLWNWRSRALELERMGMRPPEGTTFAEVIYMTAQKARDKGIPPLIDGDFPAFGRPYALQTEDEYTVTSAIAYERSSALNWLCELSSEWHGLPIDR